jgi:hypothetical protein
MLTIEARATGRRRPLIPQWQIPLPPEFTGAGRPVTLRELIAAVVEEEVLAFRERQVERRLVRVLSESEIEAQTQRGRIDSGGRTLKQEVDEGAAVGVALQGFEDGLYLVLIDEQQQRDLDEQVFLAPDSTVTFLRLVPLAGG